MDLRSKSKRLCEKIKARKTESRKVSASKGKSSNSKAKPKKNCQNTFSMIKFYESIPNYEEIRHLPDCDFTERLSLLKKIHCDLSQPCHRVHSGNSKASGTCFRKTSAKKKRDSPLKRSTVSPSLCRSFSKTSLKDLDGFDSGKVNETERMPSADSTCTPTPLKRLRSLRERLSQSAINHEIKRRISVCSPTISDIKMDYSPFVYDIESHPCDLFFNNCHSNEFKCPTFRDTPSRETPSPPKRTKEFEHIIDQSMSSPPIEACKRRRAKSCPKEIFKVTKPCLNFQENDDVYHPKCIKQPRDESTPSINPGDGSSSILSQPRKPKNILKSKPKTPNSFDEFLSSKMVRSNLAANLRQRWSRKKINDMIEEKLKETMTVAKFIPKCHQWNVRKSPAWKSFTSEDTQKEKRLREEARNEEQRLRQHAHAMHMNIMRARVGSAQLLLEGRTLSAKS